MGISIWKNAYKIGVGQIDQQHKQLINYIEKLVAALDIEDANERKKECSNVIGFTKYYAAIHFTTEEHYQDTIDFSEKEKHKLLHKEFCEDIASFEKRLNESDYDIEVLKEFADMLENWFVFHISSEDKKMVRHTNEYIDL